MPQTPLRTSRFVCVARDTARVGLFVFMTVILCMGDCLVAAITVAQASAHVPSRNDSREEEEQNPSGHETLRAKEVIRSSRRKVSDPRLCQVFISPVEFHASPAPVTAVIGFPSETEHGRRNGIGAPLRR